VLARVLTPLADLADDLSADFLFDDRWSCRRHAYAMAAPSQIELADWSTSPGCWHQPTSWSYARLTEVFRAKALSMPKSA